MPSSPTRLAQLLACAVLTLFVACGKSRPVTISVSEAEIQERLAAKFPVEKTKFLTHVTLENPDVILKDGSDRIGLSLDVIVKPPLVGPFTGKLTSSGKLAYRFDERAFYLLEPTVDGLEVNGLKDEHREKARAAVESIALAYLTSHPVYEFRARNLKEITAQYVLREVKVVNGELQAIIAPPL